MEEDKTDADEEERYPPYHVDGNSLVRCPPQQTNLAAAAEAASRSRRLDCGDGQIEKISRA